MGDDQVAVGVRCIGGVESAYFCIPDVLFGDLALFANSWSSGQDGIIQDVRHYCPAN